MERTETETPDDAGASTTSQTGEDTTSAEARHVSETDATTDATDVEGDGLAHPELPTHQQLKAGTNVIGTVVRLEEYGAFIEIPVDPETTITGLCHVSEISDDYVENIFAYVTQGKTREVRILDVKPDGKIDLSIKRADPEWSAEQARDTGAPRKSRLDRDFNKRLRKFMHKSQMIQGERRRQKRGRLQARRSS